jgi:hypothetical protein
VIHQQGEVSGADLPDILKDFREFRESTNWLGFGTSHRLAEALIGQEPRLELVRVNSIQYKLALKPVHHNISLPQVHVASMVGKGRITDARAVGHNPRGEPPASYPERSESGPRSERGARIEPAFEPRTDRPLVTADQILSMPPAQEMPAEQTALAAQEAATSHEEVEPTELIGQDTLSEMPLRVDTSVSDATEGTPENEDLKRQVVAAVREVVSSSRGPVLLARASQFVVSKLGGRVLESQWAGSGSFKKLLQSVENLELEITTQPEPGYIYDPVRHNHPARRAPRLPSTRPARAETAQAGAEANSAEDSAYASRNEADAQPAGRKNELSRDSAGALDQADIPYMLEPSPEGYLPEMAPELYLEPRTSLQEFARRVSQVTGAPLLTPLQYALVFRGIVAELQQIASGSKSYSTYQSSKAVSDWCRAEGESISHTDIALIFKGIIFQDSVRFGKQPGSYTAQELARVVRDNILSLCQRSRLELSEYERQLMDNWILDGLAVEDNSAAAEEDR